jgi:hypothetical protein
MHRLGLLALVPVALVTLAGCGPSWVVFEQTTPSPLLGQKRFAVAPIDFADVRVGVKEEAAYLAEKTPEQQAAWANDKVAVNEKFTGQLIIKAAEYGIQVVRATGPRDATLVIHAHAANLEPGYYVGVSAAPGVVTLEISIAPADGKPGDKIRIALPGGGFSVTQRLSGSAEVAGTALAKYLRMRATPGEK